MPQARPKKAQKCQAKALVKPKKNLFPQFVNERSGAAVFTLHERISVCMHGHISGLPELVVDTDCNVVDSRYVAFQLFSYSTVCHYITVCFISVTVFSRLRPVRRFPLINTMFPCAGFLVS